jgi:hypothetical protein
VKYNADLPSQQMIEDGSGPGRQTNKKKQNNEYVERLCVVE